MTASNLLVAPWLVRAHHELQRRRHLVIHGNVDDLVRWDHEYFGLPEVLGEFLAMSGFVVVTRLSRVDGLTHRDPHSAEVAQRILDGGQPAGAPRSGGPAPPGGAGQPPATPRSQQAARSADELRQAMQTRRPAQQHALSDSLAAIRNLMLQDRVACTVLIDATDLLVGTEGQLDENYPGTVAALRRVVDEARELPANELGDQLRNTLVFVARDLSAVPAWLRESPSVAAVLAERPRVDERTDLVHRQVPRFHGAGPMSEEDRRAAARRFTELTEGMTVRDIQALEVTSRISGIGADAPKRLVARHRFGLRDDPWEKLDLDKVRRAEQLLGVRVMGQDVALQAVADVLINARVGIDFVPSEGDASTRPRGVFFFVGPTGVGKTELAKALAELVFGDENAMKRFDMSEFSEEHASERLTGAPPGYVGHEQGGALTNWVLERPFSVILFDEIEKANPKIFDKFLQIIDDGRLTDGQGRTAFFSHSIVIFTSNRGASTMPTAMAGVAPTYEDIQRHFHDEVDEFFRRELHRPELRGRLGGGVVVFDMLREPAIRAITGKFLRQLTQSTRDKGYDLVIDEEQVEAAVVGEVMGTGAALGARPIRDPHLERWVRVPLTRWIAANSPPIGTRIRVRATRDSPPFEVDYDR
jgi:hypothetical protein